MIEIWKDAANAVEPDVMRELVATRNEMRAMSHRFVSIEEMLDTISRWLEGVEQHSADNSKWLEGIERAVAAEMTALRQRISTLEQLYKSSLTGNGLSALRGPLFFVADGPYGRFLVRQGDLIGDAIIRGEFWDPHLKEVIETHANRDRVAIDAGAYIGFHSVFLARHFARVYAFEPQRGAYNLLRANIELNGQRNIEASDLGLYSHSCWLRLAPDEMQEIVVQRNGSEIDYGSIENAAALSFVVSEKQTEDSVRALTIDSLNLDEVGFIKIDTQGADFCVLKGAEKTIRRCRPVVTFEFERDLSAGCAKHRPEIEASLKELGYSLTEVHQTRDGKQIDYIAIPR
jgi:FkbM family methyltransferase